MPSDFPSIPCSPSYLLFYVPFLVFSPCSVIHPPIYCYFLPRCTGFTSLFRGSSTLGWSCSRRQVFRQTEGEMCFLTHPLWVLEVWKEISQRKKEKILTGFHHARTHAGTLVLTASNPLPFDVWPLREWRVSWGLVDLWPPWCLPCWWEGRGSMGERERIYSFNLNNSFKSLFVNNLISFSFWSAVGLLWFWILALFGGGADEHTGSIVVLVINWLGWLIGAFLYAR